MLGSGDVPHSHGTLPPLSCSIALGYPDCLRRCLGALQATAAQGGTGTPMSARKLPAASAAAAGPGADQAAAPVELPAALSPAANAGQPTAQAQAELAMPG